MELLYIGLFLIVVLVVAIIVRIESRRGKKSARHKAQQKARRARAIAGRREWENRQGKSKNQEEILFWGKSAQQLSTDEFFYLWKSLHSHPNNQEAEQHFFSGVYTLYNETKNKYYVGQAQNVFVRVYNHFTGKGNCDIYDDYKDAGDLFYIRMIALQSGGRSGLDELERFTIEINNAYEKGYNKTKGNGRKQNACSELEQFALSISKST